MRDNKLKKTQYNMWQNTVHIFALAWQIYKGVIITCLVPSFLTVLTSLTDIYIAPTILSCIERGLMLSELLWVISVFIVWSILLRALNSFNSNRLGYGRNTLVQAVKIRLNEKIETTAYANIDNQSFLNKMYIAQNSCMEYANYWNSLGVLVTNLLGFIVYLWVMRSLSVLLISVSIVTALLSSYLTKRLNDWEYRQNAERAGYDQVIGHVLERSQNIAAAKDIRIFGLQAWLMGIYERTLELYRAFILRKNARYLAVKILDQLLFLLRNGVSYAYLVTMTLRYGWEVSEFLLYFNAITGFINWVTMLLDGFTGLQVCSNQISAVREFIELPEPFRFEEGDSLQITEDGKYEISLRGVFYRYPGAQEDTLRGVDLTLHTGEKLAIVGLNGAGKTTLIKLLSGLYDPTEGEVLLNGEDIRKYNRRDYYKLFSTVFQSFSLLEATVAENIAQSVTDFDRARVESCAARAGLSEMIESLPNGYDHYLGRTVHADGVELSGGQTQRLMLARALYKDAPVLLLDEPTATLDPIAESEIYQNYHDLTVGRAAVFISHRLASTRFCDRIVYLENGMIAEIGTHDELLASGGKFAHLFEVQSCYYRQEECDETKIEV